MASLMICNLDDKTKQRLRLQAARHGRSMEEEARRILAAGVRAVRRPRDNIVDAIRRIVEPIGGIDLEPLPRGTLREIPRFDDETDK